ncbi:MAG: hypothetical protein IPG89_18880 [Bacteroidetes bacterium]|nr:hypothetical protein [Bacteroidota bacterium]
MKTTINQLKTKVIKTSAVLLFTFSAFLANANNSNESELKTEASKTITQQINLSELSFVAKQNERVEIVFTTSEDGKVNFVLAKTKNAELKNQIEKQFSQLTLSKLKANVAHSIVFNFKTI